MLTDVERNVIDMLKNTPHAQPDLGKRIIRQLDEYSQDALGRIAKGELEVEHERIRANAISALGYLNTDAVAGILKGLLAEENPSLRIKAIQAFSRIDPTPVESEIRKMITQEDLRPDLSLAAARIAARIGGKEIAEELTVLRNRLLALAPSETSPSIKTMDKLIKQAKGQLPPETDDNRVPVI